MEIEDIVGNLVIAVGNAIKAKKCSLSKDNLVNIAKTIAHIEITGTELGSEYGLSASTIKRMVLDGRLPKPHKKKGEKKLLFWLDEVEFKLNDINYDRERNC